MKTRKFLAAAISLVAVGGLVINSAPASAAPARVTITAQLGTGYRLLATATSGKSYIATSSGGRVTLSNIATADTNGMSLSVLSTSGAYVGPVILRYSTDAAGKKSAKTLRAAKFGFLKMKRATKATVALNRITVNTTGKFAYLSLIKPPVAISGKTVAVSAGAPPAAKSLGRASGVRSTGLGKFANPTENKPGDDADQDGVMAFADVDDDNDGKLDLVDDKFFDTAVSDDKNVNGSAGLYTGLICGGQCVNLNAYGITNPADNPAAEAALKKMINTFQGVFFTYSSEAVNAKFPSRTSRDFGFFNIDCTGITWCSGTSAKAVTISPDYDSGQTGQPENNALPLKSGESDYKLFCGNNVIAKNPLNSNTAPTNWPLNDAGTATAYDSMMDEWVFNTCDPDGDGFPNIIPSKGTINTSSQAGNEWVNEIKPRMAGPDGMRVGDAIRFSLSDTSKSLVDSSTQVISGVMQTAPSVRTWNGTAIHDASGNYTISSAMQSPTGEVTVTFWRPQRVAMAGETSWQDVGGLSYSFVGPGGACTIKSAKSNGTTVNVTTVTFQGKQRSIVIDPALDATPNKDNFLEIVADTSNCGGNVGQWSISASDKGKNSTHFKWQRTNNQPAPQNPNPNGGQPNPGP